jgi:hypothetical protein
LDKTDSHTDFIVKLLGYSCELKPSCDELEIPVENILKGMGMQQSDADEYLLDLIGKFILKCFQLVEPRASYLFSEQIQFDLSKHQTIIEYETLDTGKIVTSFLRKSIAVILFSVTCGDKVEALSRQLMKNGHGLEGLIVDLIGSELAESITGYLHNYIKEKLAGTGFGVTNRFSPGYCNWPVSDQQKLFSLLKGNNCGIELTPSSLMLPVKSVSGIFGIGADLKRIAYKCMICNDEKCILRKK